MLQRRLIAAAAIAMVCAYAVPAYAEDPELAQIRDEIRTMKASYERRIDELEKRLADAEAKARKAETTAGQAQAAAGKAQATASQAATSAERAQATAVQAGQRPAGANAFNPAISVIFQGTAARMSQDPARYQITGFAPTGGEVEPAKRGFSLGESELFLMGNIDPYFRAQLTASLSPDNTTSVEEGYFQTLGLGHGFRIKGGRYLSGIGYLNSIHQHAWDFQDAPLAYKAFLGGRLLDDGVQVKWVAPTDLLVELGGELGRGLGFPGSNSDKNGAGAWSAFSHVGGDWGESAAWSAGLSYYHASPSGRAMNDVDPAGTTVAADKFSGSSKLWVGDFIMKWAPRGNATYTNFKLQGEYLRRTEDGALTYSDSAARFPVSTGAFNTRQSGWYLQGVYQFMPRWRVGYRYDRLNFGTVSNGLIGRVAGLTAADFPLLMTPYNPTRNTVMMDWTATEFSRIRLQLASDRSHIGATDNEVLLQYIYSLGAHGAHTF